MVYDGELLDEPEESVIDDYIGSSERLLQLKTDEVRPEHYRSFNRCRLQELVSGYIGERKVQLCPGDR